MTLAMNESDPLQPMRRAATARVRCAVCGQHLRARDLELLGQDGEAWAMGARCPLCGAQALLFALGEPYAAPILYSDLAPDEWTRFRNRPAISLDDVIVFHQFICTYAGDFSEILDEPLPEE